MTDEQIEKAAQHFAEELLVPASVPGILVPLIADIAKDSYIHGAREALASQWISVKEALPENDDHVIVFAPADSVYPDRYEIAYYDGNAWRTSDGENIRPAHWLPIPQLIPKKKIERMKKIMFNDRYGLTEAVLSGRKTQTRRILPAGTPLGSWRETERKSKYKTGEIVAIAQAYKDIACGALYDDLKEIVSNRKPETLAGWTNKMFVRADLMPHHIRITNVRVERLQDISDEDCIKEGVCKWTKDKELFKYDLAGGFEMFEWRNKLETRREAYAALIDRISGKGTWESNPYVFVYDFELVK